MKYTAFVVSGKGRGKRITFPTLNLEIPMPFPYTEGIYAGWVFIHNEKYKGAFHFGPVPTFNETIRTLEVFLLDKKLKTPPKKISFELIERVREIRMFDSPEALIQQIEKDVQSVNQILIP